MEMLTHNEAAQLMSLISLYFLLAGNVGKQKQSKQKKSETLNFFGFCGSAAFSVTEKKK